MSIKIYPCNSDILVIFTLNNNVLFRFRMTKAGAVSVAQRLQMAAVALDRTLA